MVKQINPKKILIIGSLLVAPFLLQDVAAQPPGGGPPGPPAAGDPPCWPPPCIPIDGGVGFLIAAGIALGGKKAYDLKKQIKEVE